MRVKPVLLITCLVIMSSGAIGQGITGTLMEGQVLNTPYSLRANVFLEQDDQLLDQSADSGEDGVFLIEDVPPDTYNVFIVAEERGKIVISDVIVSTEGITNLGIIPLFFECSVSGTVTEPDGVTFLANVSVILESDSGFDILDMYELTDDTGSFKFNKLSTGDYILKFFYEGQFFGERVVSFTQPSQHTLLEPISPPPIGSISGRVTRADGVTGIQNVNVLVFIGTEFITAI